jgi:hypothetical protein
MSLWCCAVCRAEASPDLQLQYCAVCKSALYCSEACQSRDWKKQHKKICKLLNVGHGDMQVRSDIHTRNFIQYKEHFETQERMLNGDDKRFFKLSQESTFERSQAAARKKKKIAEQKTTKSYQKFLLFQSVHLLVHSYDSKMLSWPNSPLLVLIQLVGPNVLAGDDDEPLEEVADRPTPLYLLVELVDPSDYSTHKNQLILAKQLIEHGANVNTVTRPQGQNALA